MSRVLIGLPTADIARQAVFYDHFNAMEKPIDSIIMGVHGQSPARNRNIIIQMALDKECTHVLFLDDDLIMPRDMLIQLLAHDKDIVSGLYLMRNSPHKPIVFDHAEPDGRCSTYFLKEGQTGLIEAKTVGFGCMLVNTEVFKKMKEPWVRLGELESDHWCDDVGFCLRARNEANAKIYCDLDIQCGHMGTVTIRPFYQDGKWYTTLDTNGEYTITIPAVVGVPVGKN